MTLLPMSDVSSSTGEAPAALPTAISWTGGKDSNLALLLAALDLRFDVAALVVFRPQNAAFRAHPLSFMHAQAASLALPLYEVEVGGSSTQEYRDSYVRGLQGLREQHGIAVVVTGDMDLMVGSTVNWMQDCCGAAGVRPHPRAIFPFAPPPRLNEHTGLSKVPPHPVCLRHRGTLWDLQWLPLPAG